jgi:hypothetical protein
MEQPLFLNTRIPATHQLVMMVNHLLNQPFTNEYGFMHLMRDKWSTNAGKCQMNIHDLDITEHIGIIRENYENYGVIVLRKYNGEKYCTIGCGNKPLLDGCAPFENETHKSEYQAKHQHLGHYTISCELGCNPSVVGFFSSQEFKNIPDESFEKVYIEMVYLNPTKLFYSEFLRILKCGGVIYVTNVRDPVYYKSITEVPCFVKDSKNKLTYMKPDKSYMFSNSYFTALSYGKTQAIASTFGNHA